MSRSTLRISSAALLMLVGLADLGPVSAGRAMVPDQRPSFFPTVMLPPAEENGYAELLQAGEALSASHRYQRAEQLEREGKLTLAQVLRLASSITWQ